MCCSETRGGYTDNLLGVQYWPSLRIRTFRNIYEKYLKLQFTLIEHKPPKTVTNELHSSPKKKMKVDAQRSNKFRSTKFDELSHVSSSIFGNQLMGLSNLLPTFSPHFLNFCVPIYGHRPSFFEENCVVNIF